MKTFVLQEGTVVKINPLLETVADSVRTGLKFPEGYAMFYNGPALKNVMITVSMPMHHQPCIQGVPVTKTELIKKVSESSKISKKDVHAVIEGFLVENNTKVFTYHFNPRSKLLQRNTTGFSFHSEIPFRIRSFSSSFEETRMCRKKVRVIFEKAVSTRLSQEPCLGVWAYSNRLGRVAR